MEWNTIDLMTVSDDCVYGVDQLGPRRLMTVITEWTTLDHGVWWSWLYRGPPWTMTSDDLDYIGGPPWTMMSDGCDSDWDHLVPWRLMIVITEWTSLNHDVWWSWLRSGPHWTMNYVYYDYGVGHLGPWRLMAVITYGSTLDHDVWWLWLKMGTTLEHDVWWPWLQMGTTIASFARHDIVVVLGDLNATLGSDRRGYESVLGPHSSGSRNDNGERLFDLCALHQLKITGSWFRRRNMHRWTWISNDGRTKNELDYIIVSARWNIVQNCRMYRSADCGNNTNHRLVAATCSLRLKRCSLPQDTSPPIAVEKLLEPTIWSAVAQR